MEGEINSYMNIEEVKEYTKMYLSYLPCDNFLYDEEDRQRRYDRLSKAEKLSHCVSVINKGNRFSYLDYLYKLGAITDQECADEVYSIWTMQERFHDCGMCKTKLIKFMKMAMKSPLLQSDIDDLSPDDMVTIYRGVGINSHKGLSWTTDKNVAEWFAKRFKTDGDKGYVFTGRVHKKDIIGLFNNRNEQEVVCDYRKVKDIQCEEIIICDSVKSQFNEYVENTIMCG